MVLDLRAGTLSFALKKNEKSAEAVDQGVMYSDIERKEGLFYNMAVSLHGVAGKVQILRHRISVTDHDFPEIMEDPEGLTDTDMLVGNVETSQSVEAQKCCLVL